MSKITIELDKDFVNKLMYEKWLIEDIKQCDEGQILYLRDTSDALDYEYLQYLCSRVTSIDSILNLLNVIKVKQITSKIRPTL